LKLIIIFMNEEKHSYDYYWVNSTKLEGK